MKIITINDQEIYQKAWSKQKSSILQSWQWGEFKGGSQKILRILIDNYPVTIFIKQIPGSGWKFGYIPHGEPKSIFTESLPNKLQKIMEENNLSHIIIDPYIVDERLHVAPKGFLFSGEPTVQTRQTIVTDLLENENEMLGRMRKKHRQYIRKSERLGLIFETDDSLDGVKRLAKVLADQHTTKKYLAYPFEYYEKLWTTFEGTNMVHIHVVTSSGHDIGAYMVIDGTDKVFQFYGGTTSEGRDKYGVYLLTWKSMLAARNRGFKLYDQWGISPYDEDGRFDSDDEKYGISIFKEGFSGKKITYGQQLAIVRGQSRYTIYKNLVKLHRAYIKFRKSF